MKKVKPLTSFAAVNQYLERFYENVSQDYTLDNMVKLMDYLGNPQEKFRTIHIAGTSGKTSTAYYTAALLRAAGLKVGLTISPHIDEVNQRVQINLQPLPEAVFTQALSQFLTLVEASGLQPSWFELMVAFAYWYFAREAVDYAVVEVGLGGLKDGTNVISRPDKIAVITDIGIDHAEVLGKTLSEIAVQKFGIVHPGNNVIMFEQDEAVMQVAAQVTEGQNATLMVANQQSVAQALAGELIPLPDFQLRNWLLAHCVYVYLAAGDKLPGLTSEALQKTMAIAVPGRMEIQQLGSKTLILDGAHNAQKMTAFLDSFKLLYPKQKPAVLISLKEGKEYDQVVPLLVPLASRIITTSFRATQDLPSHSIDPEVLARAFKDAGATNVTSLSDQRRAVQALLESPERILLITGSFYLLGQIRNNGYLK